MLKKKKKVIIISNTSNLPSQGFWRLTINVLKPLDWLHTHRNTSQVFLLVCSQFSGQLLQKAESAEWCCCKQPELCSPRRALQSVYWELDVVRAATHHTSLCRSQTHSWNSQGLGTLTPAAVKTALQRQVFLIVLPWETFQFNIEQNPPAAGAQQLLHKINKPTSMCTQILWELQCHGNQAFQRCSWHFHFWLNFKTSAACSIFIFFFCFTFYNFSGNANSNF